MRAHRASRCKGPAPACHPALRASCTCCPEKEAEGQQQQQQQQTLTLTFTRPSPRSLQWKVAPALAAGNCCILKPSELASVSCLELAAIAQVRRSGGWVPE